VQSAVGFFVVRYLSRKRKRDIGVNKKYHLAMCQVGFYIGIKGLIEL
jgi:hypothetical protein